MSKYFDINMIDDYLDLGLRFRVYVDGEYLVVNDPWELINDKVGIGYDSKGDSVEFEYMDIDHVMIGSIILTKEDLIKLEKPDEESTDSEEQGGEEGAAEETDQGAEQQPPEESTPEEEPEQPA
jgi:hypothetical protein